MTLYGGSARETLEHERASWKAYHDEEHEKRERENEIIEHVELATKTKAIYVAGELHYIPLEEAKRLGLLEPAQKG